MKGKSDMVRHKLSLKAEDLEKLHETLQPIHDAYEHEKQRLEECEGNEMELDDLHYKLHADLAEAGFEHGILFGLRLYINHFKTSDQLTLRLSDEEGVRALIERMLERR